MRLREFSPWNNKITHSYIKEQKGTLTHHFLKLWIERKYTVEHLSLKIYKKGSCISCGKDTERYHKLFVKAWKGVSTIVCPI